MRMVTGGTNTGPEPHGLLKSLLGLIPFLPQLGVLGQTLFSQLCSVKISHWALVRSSLQPPSGFRA